ncbi:hypothetical protein ASC90_05410 [Rhizobium sp. Root1220]|nr:hypothetical protein ASC90_05410 [Rhizobium sp. Root1220]
MLLGAADFLLLFGVEVDHIGQRGRLRGSALDGARPVQLGFAEADPRLSFAPLVESLRFAPNNDAAYLSQDLGGISGASRPAAF